MSISPSHIDHPFETPTPTAQDESTAVSLNQNHLSFLPKLGKTLVKSRDPWFETFHIHY